MSFWRDLTGSALQADLDRFVRAARDLGFSERVGSAIASQVIARLLIQTGRGFDELTAADFADLDAAGKQREQPPTPKPAAGSTKPTGTTASSPGSTPS